MKVGYIVGSVALGLLFTSGVSLAAVEKKTELPVLTAAYSQHKAKRPARAYRARQYRYRYKYRYKYRYRYRNRYRYQRAYRYRYNRYYYGSYPYSYYGRGYRYYPRLYINFPYGFFRPYRNQYYYGGYRYRPYRYRYRYQYRYRYNRPYYRNRQYRRARAYRSAYDFKQPTLNVTQDAIEPAAKPASYRRGFPTKRRATGNRVFIFSPRLRAWAAYNSRGRLVSTGRASGGKHYCADVGRSCRTPRGVFRVYSKGSVYCKSNTYPKGRGGAPMPYCMFFHKAGYAIHGSPDVPRYNASHGCIRVLPRAARWLSRSFIRHGTTVIVTNY